MRRSGTWELKRLKEGELQGMGMVFVLFSNFNFI